MNQKMRKLINEFAQIIVDTYSITIPIENMDDVVSCLGGIIKPVENILATAEGSIQKTNDNKFQILLYDNNPMQRKNFTVAHELGHLFLHMGYLVDQRKWENHEGTYYRSGSNELELEANEFAAAFLMPQDLYKSKLDEYTNSDGSVDMQPVADYFKVSVEAAANRGKWLGYLQW